MSNILKSYKDIDESNIDLYLEELLYEDEGWYRIVDDKVEFKDFRHNRLKSIQNYNDFEKLLRESYAPKAPSNMVSADPASGDYSSGGGLYPRWRKFAVTYNGEFIKYNGEPVTYGA